VTQASQAINKTHKTEDAYGSAITTVMVSVSHNILSTHLQHQLRPEYLQPNKHHLYGYGYTVAGVCHIRINGIMSLPS